MCVCVYEVTKIPKSSHRAQFLLYRLFQSTKLFDLPDYVIAISAECFGEGLRAGGGVVFNVEWRRYMATLEVKYIRTDIPQYFQLDPK